ncbi:2-aminoethylphosphonate aminotransferase [Robbsia sp. Bb-Pol-6]|uniref:2-aminoethylphosphonate--pyruvate transaminase n=1 Tax=Robbsia betulipollinis TaxID=2981849 RepID=A0ABT3ZN38_9BURK|nr:2-aminoethylphosphonate aminotransferase [Robbsia betulipollinis]MCY0387940.1 2-aminoethylphosphonate aminotransferase [Robbsia betulipollinis]
MLLLNPGPVTLSERVRRSLLQTDLCHREDEFFDLQDEIRARLLDVYALDAARWAPVLLTGSGTAAVEAMMSSLPGADARLLIIENGVYGERMSAIATRHGIAHETVRHAWGAPVDVAAVIARLDTATPAMPAVTHVGIVHHETTTGRLNAVGAVGAACRARGIGVLLDAVSSFGAEMIDFAGWGITAAAATANKCLHGVPGACFVIAARDALAQAAPRTLYLDLPAWARAQDARGTPFTPSVHAYYALLEALREFADEGGLDARQARYAALADQARAGLAAMGIEGLLEPRDASVVLRAYRLPDGIDYPLLHDTLKRHGFVIYAGQGALAKAMFRISTMGAITAPDIDRLLAVIRGLLAARPAAD